MKESVTRQFIEEVKNRPSIWDSSSDDYTNRELKKKCWEDIVDVIGGDQLSVAERYELGSALQKRWKNLRGSYVRELQRQKKTKSGLEIGPRKNEYKFFKQLHFLENVVSFGSNNEELHDPDYTNEEVVLISNSDFQFHGNANSNGNPRIRKRRAEDDEELISDSSNKIITDRELRKYYMEEDEDRLFLLSLLQPLKTIPKERRLSVKIDLMTVLNEAQFKYQS